jgi:hypothetical protein
MRVLANAGCERTHASATAAGAAAQLRGDRVERVNDPPLPLAWLADDPRPARVDLAGAARPLAGEQPAAQRAPRHRGHAELQRHGQQLALSGALQQRVLELQRDGRRPALQQGDRLRLGGDPGRDVAQADVADRAGGDEVVERVEGLLDEGARRSQLCSQ